MLFGRVLIDVKPEAEAWWPILETLLATERQAILPEKFDAAWKSPNARQPPRNHSSIRTSLRKSATRNPRRAVCGISSMLKHKAAAAYLDQLVGNLHAGGASFLYGRA